MGKQLVLHWLGRKRGWVAVVQHGRHRVVQQCFTDELWIAGEQRFTDELWIAGEKQQQVVILQQPKQGRQE